MGKLTSMFFKRPERITKLFFPVTRATDETKNGLETYLSDARREGRKLAVGLIDDARSESASSVIAQMGAALASHGFPVEVYSRARRVRIARQLAGVSGVPAPLVEEALAGRTQIVGADAVTIGAARNSMMLFAGESLFLMADDDTHLIGKRVSTFAPRLTVTSGIPPSEFWFGSQREPALAPDDLSIFASHEQLLGRTAQKVIAEFNRNNAMRAEQVSPALAARANHRGTTVAITLGGISGDSGMTYPSPYFLTDKESEKRLLENETHFNSTFLSHDVLWGFTGFALTDNPTFLSYCAGLDGRRELPPFYPQFRNEDGLFAFVASRCMHDSVFGAIPQCVGHTSKIRDRSDAALEIALRTWTFTGTVVAVILGLPAGNDSYFALARSLRDVASESAASLRERIRAGREKMSSYAITSATERLESGRVPKFFEARLKNFVELSISAKDQIDPICHEFTHLDADQQISALRGQFQVYANLLESWSTLRKAARALELAR